MQEAAVIDKHIADIASDAPCFSEATSCLPGPPPFLSLSLSLSHSLDAHRTDRHLFSPTAHLVKTLSSLMCLPVLPPPTVLWVYVPSGRAHWRQGKTAQP